MALYTVNGLPQVFVYVFIAKSLATQTRQHMAQKNTFIFTDEWCGAISSYLKEHKRIHALTLPDLAVRLKALDIDITPSNLGSRINSGKLSATLFIAVLVAMGEDDLDTKDILRRYREAKE
jgi:hypothetical protein